jgi:hypothetical protein
MEKLSRRKALLGLAAASAGAAVAGAAKAEGTQDPNLKSQEERLRNRARACRDRQRPS